MYTQSTTFFPTRISNSQHKDIHTIYKLIKKQNIFTEYDNFDQFKDQQIRKKFNSNNNNTTGKIKVENIFKDKLYLNNNKNCDDNCDRPIGGLELFKKIEKAHYSNTQESMVKISKKGSKCNIKDVRDKVLMNSATTSNQIPTAKEDSMSSKGQFKLTEFKQETLLKHEDPRQKYNFTKQSKFTTATQLKNPNNNCFNRKDSIQSSPKVIVFTRCSSALPYQRRPTKHQSCLKQKGSFTSTNTKNNRNSAFVNSNIDSLKQQPINLHERWISQQQHQYLDKKAILNEINYNKPLVQKLGNKYFQCLLRDRYLDEPEYTAKSPFIYQIKDKVNQPKFISKIKNLKVNYLQRTKMILTGASKLKKEENARQQQKQAKRRWEEWNIQSCT